MSPTAVMEAMATVAESVASSLDLKEVLLGVVQTSRGLLDAERASVLLLDKHRRLSPAVSVGRLEDHDLWLRFRAMEPIDTQLLPLANDVLAAGRAVAINDVTTSSLVPESVRLAFGLRSILLAPLVVHDEPLGVLVIDHGASSHRFHDGEIRIVEGIAASAAVAVRNGLEYSRQAKHTVGLDRMLSLTTALNAARGLHEVLQVAMDGFVEMLGGQSCSVTLFSERGDLITLASRGRGQPEPGTYAASVLEPPELESILAACAEDPPQPLFYIGPTRDALRGYAQGNGGELLLVPLAERKTARGFLLVQLVGEQRPDQESLALATSLAAQVWLAIDRARLSDDVSRRLQHLELLYRLSDDLALGPDMGLVTERLAPSVRAACRGELIEAYLCDPASARMFGAAQPPRSLPGLSAWRRGLSLRPVTTGGLIGVPMLLEGQLIGVLRVRSPDGRPPDAQEEDLLLAIAEGLADVVTRTVLRAQIAASERELAVADERERIGRDLHDTLGQLLAGLASGLDVLGSELTEPSGGSRLNAREHVLRLRGMVGEANTELRQAIHALAFLGRRDRGLVRPLRELGRGFASRVEGTEFLVRVVGRVRPLPPNREEALFRVAHEALNNVARHARASTARLVLTYAEDRVTLSVTDDGVGLAMRGDVDESLHFGLRTMRRRMAEAGGGLEINNRRPRGARLAAWVPA
jgi:signal transduction histidine kinase